MTQKGNNMEKKRWNQNLIDKYDDIMDQLYLTIADILREKLGEEITISYEGGETEVGILRHVGNQVFAISFGKDDDIPKYFHFSSMQAFPFFENNNINMIVDKDEW